MKGIVVLYAVTHSNEDVLTEKVLTPLTPNVTSASLTWIPAMDLPKDVLFQMFKTLGWHPVKASVHYYAKFIEYTRTSK